MEHDHSQEAAAASGDFFSNLLQDYVPRQVCMYHQPDLIWLHIVSDSLIAFSYYSIPIALVYFARKRKDLAFNWMFLFFALFILLCGTTHIFGVIAMWHAYYRLDGLIKALTAAASVGTAVVLWRLMPHALALPSLNEITKRKEELETLVAQRTSELTEINRALRQSRDRAEAANRAKSEFLANMSHEIRTPMNAIVGLTELLQQGSVPPEKQGRFLKTLGDSSQQLLALINDLLDISKIESKNNMELDETAFSLSRVISEAISINAVLAARKGVELTSDCDCEDGLEVLGDPLRLKQVLTNIIGNAVKFTEKGSVRVHAICKERKPFVMDVTIHIQDTGIGIPAEKLDLIFNEFYQGDAGITRKYGGTGLGLSISKTLLDLMGGEISVKSTPGEGSCFTIRMAMKKTGDHAQSAQPQTINEKKKSAKANILLVEDNEANILVASSILNSLGHTCRAVTSGAEALEILKTERPDIILMDIQMPGMDGFQATKLIREKRHHQGEKLPIIGVTAHALVGDKEKCLEAGMDDYLSKPFNIAELREVINRHLRKETPKLCS